MIRQPDRVKSQFDWQDSLYLMYYRGTHLSAVYLAVTAVYPVHPPLINLDMMMEGKNKKQENKITRARIVMYSTYTCPPPYRTYIPARQPTKPLYNEATINPNICVLFSC